MAVVTKTANSKRRFEMAPELNTSDAKSALALLKEVTPMIEKWASATPPEPTTVASPAVNASRVNAYEEMVELRSELVKHNDAQLSRMIGLQLIKGAREGQGVPLSRWLAGDRAAYQIMQGNDIVSKALDTGSGSALIRQDLEPLLYAAFVRRFPLWDRLRKESSNGLVHSYNRQDAAPDATFISELGTVGSGTGTYTRATANIAIAAIKVGTSLKMQFVPSAGGVNPETAEIESGLTGLRRVLQRTVFSGNATVPGKVATDPEGAFNVNAFDGLRGSIPTANKSLHDPANFTLLESLNLADSVLSVFGGQSSILVMDARDKTRWLNELQAGVRYILPSLPLLPGLPNIQGISLGNSGDVPVMTVPGDEIGHYTSGGDDVRDAYFLDESTISIPFLGSEMPTILDIPTGVDGTLSHVFILFQMAGLAMKIPNYLAALRIPTP